MKESDRKALIALPVVGPVSWLILGRPLKNEPPQIRRGGQRAPEASQVVGRAGTPVHVGSLGDEALGDRPPDPP